MGAFALLGCGKPSAEKPPSPQSSYPTSVGFIGITFEVAFVGESKSDGKAKLASASLLSHVVTNGVLGNVTAVKMRK